MVSSHRSRVAHSARRASTLGSARACARAASRIAGPSGPGLGKGECWHFGTWTIERRPCSTDGRSQPSLLGTKRRLEPHWMRTFGSRPSVLSFPHPPRHSLQHTPYITLVKLHTRYIALYPQACWANLSYLRWLPPPRPLKPSEVLTPAGSSVYPLPTRLRERRPSLTTAPRSMTKRASRSNAATSLRGPA